MKMRKTAAVLVTAGVVGLLGLVSAQPASAESFTSIGPMTQARCLQLRKVYLADYRSVYCWPNGWGSGYYLAYNPNSAR